MGRETVELQEEGMAEIKRVATEVRAEMKAERRAGESSEEA
jgi:hypothetical protein